MQVERGGKRADGKNTGDKAGLRRIQIQSRCGGKNKLVSSIKPNRETSD